MTPQEKAESLGIAFTKQEPGYLALVVRTGNLLITSGHVSDIKGKLGAGLTVEQGKAAARDCAVKILNSVWNAHGTLDGLRVLKLLGCVNSTLEFDEQHLVVNGCSDLLHEIFGKAGDGYHARTPSASPSSRPARRSRSRRSSRSRRDPPAVVHRPRSRPESPRALPGRGRIHLAQDGTFLRARIPARSIRATDRFQWPWLTIREGPWRSTSLRTREPQARGPDMLTLFDRDARHNRRDFLRIGGSAAPRGGRGDPVGPGHAPGAGPRRSPACSRASR